MARLRIYLLFILVSACVEPIEFEVPSAETLIIVEGSITNEDTTYQVQISRAIPVNADTLIRPPVKNARVTLFDDDDNSEDFTEVSPGIYETSGVMRGEIGRSYHIRIEMEDGKVFESEPDLMKPVGTVQDIRYEYEERLEEEFFGVVRKDVFNIFIDSDAGPGLGNYVRWRYKGTYRIVTNPERREIILAWSDSALKAPRPCSGFVTAGTKSGVGTRLVKVAPCTCCECWISEPEKAPQLSDDLLIADKQFNNIKVGEVPISNVTFYDKYMVEVEQMSLSQTAFEFFKLVRIQKTQASNIFQPPSGEIVGNIRPTNSDERVVGLFYASAVSKNKTFIDRDAVPYLLTPTELIPESCLLKFDYSTTEKPKKWED